MSLVDRRNSRYRARLMIKDLICDMRRNAETRHSRNAGAAQIMEPPPRHSREPVKFAFRFTELLERL